MVMVTLAVVIIPPCPLPILREGYAHVHGF
jgi:hypothetical protein